MDSVAMRKRAAWLEAVAQRLDSDRSAEHLTRYAAALSQIADDIDMFAPREARLQRHA